MLFLFLLVLTEIMVLSVLRQHLYSNSRVYYYIILVIHIILSSWLWILYIELESYKGFYDNPAHIWLLMNMTGMISAVVVPRIILIIFHYTGWLLKLKTGRQSRWLTNTGLFIMFIFLAVIGSGTFIGRFNFKTESVNIKVKGLRNELDGLKIVQLSDLHLSGFYHHKHLLEKAIDKANSYEPDLLLNTGDFVSYGWREFDTNDTILNKSRSRYGNFAVMGNHDFGTYHPFFTEADRENNVLIMNRLIRSSGYTLLNDESAIVNIGAAKVAIIGVTTKGSHPDIIHGDLAKAMSKVDSADLKILLSHDPNHWEAKVRGKTDIDLTLSGHTHGMQMGIITKKFRWSPSKYFYPHWNGLFTEGNQFQYVNRGLGVLVIPFRILMPPEITVITLQKE